LEKKIDGITEYDVFDTIYLLVSNPPANKEETFTCIFDVPGIKELCDNDEFFTRQDVRVLLDKAIENNVEQVAEFLLSSDKILLNKDFKWMVDCLIKKAKEKPNFQKFVERLEALKVRAVHAAAMEELRSQPPILRSNRE
jgi:cell fate (sporulation/competence/biofilm development) regulator YmcA (YheA/YmcA/DUF963 family)